MNNLNIHLRLLFKITLTERLHAYSTAASYGHLLIWILHELEFKKRGLCAQDAKQFQNLLRRNAYSRKLAQHEEATITKYFFLSYFAFIQLLFGAKELRGSQRWCGHGTRETLSDKGVWWRNRYPCCVHQNMGWRVLINTFWGDANIESNA